MKTTDQGYYRLLSKVGKDLGLGPRASELAISEYCIAKLDEFLLEAGASPKNLSEVLNLVAARLNLGIREIHSPADLEELLKDIPPRTEPVIAMIPRELKEGTDAVVVHRPNCKAWEQPYLAVINCLGSHFYRRYFSKWHEVTHLLLEGRQMTFAFRKTTLEEREKPLEILVDRVTGQLAFYQPLFKPVVDREVAATGRLTFEGIQRIKSTAAPEASRQATIYACIRHTDTPVAYVRLGLGLKKEEEERLTTLDLFPETVSPAEPKLRVKEFSVNGKAASRGMRMFKNMSISNGTLAARAFHSGSALQGEEDLSTWRNDGPKLRVHIETLKQQDELHCILHAI